jgi:hypothetical protein
MSRTEKSLGKLIALAIANYGAKRSTSARNTSTTDRIQQVPRRKWHLPVHTGCFEHVWIAFLIWSEVLPVGNQKPSSQAFPGKLVVGRLVESPTCFCLPLPILLDARHYHCTWADPDVGGRNSCLGWKYGDARLLERCHHVFGTIDFSDDTRLFPKSIGLFTPHARSLPL